MATDGSHMRFSVVIPAAGSGSRMGAPIPKVLLGLPVKSSNRGSDKFIKPHQTQSILRRTLETFAAQKECHHVVVCVPAEWVAQFEHEVAGLDRVALVVGGATRQDSVRRGIEHLCCLEGVLADSIVLVHDAARCCVTGDLIAAVVDGVREFGAVTAGVKVHDSLCRSDMHGRISEYVDRQSLWAVQTPQGFILSDLLRAHREAIETGTEALDDAGLVARFRPITIVPGARGNIKVTEPADLEQIAKSSY